MVIFELPKKKYFKDDEVKTKIKFALLPVLLKEQYPRDYTGYIPSYRRTKMIWLEKYIKTFTYYKSARRWILRKSERICDAALEKLSN